MARVFNGSIWNGIGDTISMQDALRREQNKEALGGLLDTAKFIEKANASRKLRQDWEDYFKRRNGEAAVEAEVPEVIWGGDPSLDGKDAINNVVRYGFDPMNGNVFDIKQPVVDIAGSIWDGEDVPEVISDAEAITGVDDMLSREIGNDYDNRMFMLNFNPYSKDQNEIRRAQRIIGTKADGIFGNKSWGAYRKYMEGIT